MIGERFGKWTVIKHIEGLKYECLCDCGNQGIVSKSNLRSAFSRQCRSCGKENSKRYFNVPFGKGVNNR